MGEAGGARPGRPGCPPPGRGPRSAPRRLPSSRWADDDRRSSANTSAKSPPVRRAAVRTRCTTLSSISGSEETPAGRCSFIEAYYPMGTAVSRPGCVGWPGRRRRLASPETTATGTANPGERRHSGGAGAARRLRVGAALRRERIDRLAGRRPGRHAGRIRAGHAALAAGAAAPSTYRHRCLPCCPTGWPGCSSPASSPPPSAATSSG